MENKTYTKPMYKCAICDSIYENIAERVKCEQSCLKKKQEEEKKAATEKKMAEKKIRKEAVDEAVANAFRLVNAYMKDYGSYEYDRNVVEDCVWPSRIWHYFG